MVDLLKKKGEKKEKKDCICTPQPFLPQYCAIFKIKGVPVQPQMVVKGFQKREF